MSKIIKKYLETLTKQKKFDRDFINILIQSNELGEEGDKTTSKILNLIEKRYDKSKKVKT